MDPTKETLMVEVVFQIDKDAGGYPKSRDFEALLCKPLNPECSLCVVNSVPFYLRNVAYGDTIRTKDDASNSLGFEGIVRRGGYSVYRVLLHDTAKKDDVVNHLLKFDALVEQNGNLIAFAVPPTADSDAIVDYILEGKRKGFWGAQDGYISENS